MHTYQLPSSEPLVISSADELTAWAQRVNEGDKTACNAYVVLERTSTLATKNGFPLAKAESMPLAACSMEKDIQSRGLSLRIKKERTRDSLAF